MIKLDFVDPIAFFFISFAISVISQFGLHILSLRNHNNKFLPKLLPFCPYLFYFLLAIYSFVGILSVKYSGKDLFPNLFQYSTFYGDAELWLAISVVMFLGSLATTILWTVGTLFLSLIRKVGRTM